MQTWRKLRQGSLPVLSRQLRQDTADREMVQTFSEVARRGFSKRVLSGQLRHQLTHDGKQGNLLQRASKPDSLQSK